MPSSRKGADLDAGAQRYSQLRIQGHIGLQPRDFRYECLHGRHACATCTRPNIRYT